jgi:uncharacterized membrane protein YdjX (TVP38/TMEM64 family)
LALPTIYLVHRGAIDPVAIRDAVAGSVFAPLIFIALQVAASLLFVPRTFLGIAAGLLFGLAWGSVLAILGALAGAAAGFALWRWVGHGQIDIEATPRIGPLIDRAEKGGWRAVAIVRLVPWLPHGVANTALALTKLGWRDYLVGSFIGMLPMTLFQVDVGAAGGHIMDGGRGLLTSLALLVALFALSFSLRRKAQRSTDESDKN